MSTIFDYDDGTDLVPTGDIVAGPPGPTVLESAGKTLKRAAGLAFTAMSASGRQRLVDDGIGEDPAETFEAAREAALLGGRVDSRDIAYRRAYEPVVDALNSEMRKAPMFGASPDRDSFVSNPYLYGRQVNPNAESQGGANQDELRIWSRIAERRKTDPNFLSHLGRNRDEFISLVDMAASRDLEAAEQTAGQGGLVTRLAGSLAGSITDPVNLASTLVGAGSAKTILGVAAREAAINAAAEVAVTPVIAERRKELGQDTTAGDVAVNVGTAAAFGGIVGGLFELGARALRMPDLRSDREVLDDFDANVPEPTPEQAQARAVLAEKVEMEEASPFGDAPEAVAVHLERLDDAVVALQNDLPIPPAPMQTRDSLVVFHGGKLEGEIRAPLFASDDRAFAETYAADRGGEVSELTVSPQRIAEEADIADAARSAGTTLTDLDALTGGMLLDEAFNEAAAATITELRSRGFDVARFRDYAVDEGDVTGAAIAILDPAAVVAREARSDAAPGPLLGEGAGIADPVRAAEVRPTASWAIREKETGAVIMETFDRKKVDALNTKRYEAVPIQEYLGSINGQTTARPPRAAQVQAEAAAVRDFAEPAGKGQREQTEVLDHELRAQFGEPFGPSHPELASDWSAAVARLVADGTGEVPAALRHPDVGDIDVIWGNDKGGLAHIVADHPDVVSNLPAIINEASVTSRSANRIRLESDTHHAVVRLDYDGNAKRWLLTAFRKDREAPAPTEDGRAGTGGRDGSPDLGADDNIDLSELRRNDATGFALAETVDGAELRTFDDIKAELDADDAAISALEACLK